MGRRRFSREFKVEAVKLVTERGVAIKQAAQDLDVGESVLRRWVKELAADPGQAFLGHGQLKPEQAELVRLRRENARLKAERDILKKAVVDSTGRCNTRYPFPEMEGVIHGTDGTTRAYREAEGGVVAPMEARRVVE